MQSLNRQIAEAEATIARSSAPEHWLEPMTFLVQETGLGLYTDKNILGAIGEIERFSATRKLVGYAGLEGRVYATRGTYYMERFPNEEDENYILP